MQPEKMSDIFKKMAISLMKEPKRTPSQEAVHATLLFAHVAWNRANGQPFPESSWKSILRAFEDSRPALWAELKVKTPRAAIKSLIEFKRDHFPGDNRLVVACGMREGNIRVEWRYP